MGQKASPKLLRLTTVEEWDNNWIDIKSNFPNLVLEDYNIRAFLHKELKNSAVSKIKISRNGGKVNVVIKSARTGYVLGKSGENINRITKKIHQSISKNILLNVIEEKNPETSSQLLAENVAQQIEKRIPFRRAMKSVIQTAMKAGAIGVKISCSGRLGGVEIARKEWYLEGSVPLHTFRANIDYTSVTAQTIYGNIGVKVWVNNGIVY